MKFGKYLKENISSPWRLEYIQYDLLKTYLKNRQFDHTWNEENETAFIKLFINEKNKVTQFIHNFTQQLLARIKYSEHLLKRTKSCDQSAELSNTSDFTSDFLNNLDDTLIEILFDIHDFSCFIRLNSLGFKKILKKHKKWTLIDHENYISSTASPYDISSISSLLTQYNRQMYSQVSALRFLCHSNKKTFLNACIEKEGDLVSSIVPERRSKKYWIHPDHISEVTAILCMHSYIDPKRFSTLNKQQQLDLSMTNIYFDNDHMDVHADRCASKANTQAIKCKRYGSLLNDAIYFEHEVHNTFCLGDISNKIRFKMEHHLLQDFCDGSHKVPLKTDEKEAIKMNNLDRNDKTMFAKTTQDGIASRFLRPLLQCDYDRLSFETPYTNKGLQITLDTNISFSHLQGTMFTENKDNEAYNFPYAVLEVKLDTDTKFDDPSLYWLNAFTQKCKLLHEIPRFSKYIQGIYQVFSAQTSAENDIYTAVQGRLPTWINLYQKRISASANYDSLSRSKSLRPLLNGKSYRGIIPYINRSNDGTKSLSSSSPVSNRYSIIHRYSSSTRHNNSDYTSISMPVDDQITRSAVLVQNENLKFVPDMNEKTEMQFSTTIESSVKSSPVSSSNSDRFLWKHDNNSDCNNKLILDRDGNPIVYKNQPKAFFKSSHRKKGVDVEQYVKESNKKKKNNDDLVKIEPKVFFANERTFISWLQFCALLLTVALNLLNFGDHISRICGALFLSISAVLALYALARFQCRAWQLRTPNYKGRFDDIYGPAVLCVLIVAALIINFWLRFRYMPEIDSNRSYLKVGSNSTTI